ncbi:MAG TPA: DUF5615 family PIN-like protein [Terriglobia bacterium]|nr:DUF5615 family PIN-like protein [Terriglobia bacterium]
MKLLFDENLSRRLVEILHAFYPGSSHVRNFGLQRSDDELIWDLARREGLTIASKDGEFHQRSFLRGFPPKVIWVRLGNCSTQEVAAVLRRHQSHIRLFCDDEFHAFLILP